MSLRRMVQAGFGGLALTGLVSCGPAATPAATTVNVTLQEWAVVPDATSVPAGTVTFQITNQGPEDEHEFVIIRTDSEAGELPTDDQGAVDEEAADLTVVDEVEELAVGDSASLTVDLEAGNYVLVCNLVEAMEGMTHVHYALGMRIPFTVE